MSNLIIDTGSVNDDGEVSEYVYNDQRFLNNSYHSSQNSFEKSIATFEFCIQSQIFTAEFALTGITSAS